MNLPSLPRFRNVWNIDESEMWAKTTPPIIHGEINYHGCIMLLYSLKAPTDLESRMKVIAAARKLAEFGAIIRGKSGLKHVHASLLLMVSNPAIDMSLCADLVSLLTSISYISLMLLEFLHRTSALLKLKPAISSLPCATNRSE